MSRSSLVGVGAVGLAAVIGVVLFNTSGSKNGPLPVPNTTRTVQPHQSATGKPPRHGVRLMAGWPDGLSAKEAKKLVVYYKIDRTYYKVAPPPPQADVYRRGTVPWNGPDIEWEVWSVDLTEEQVKEHHVVVHVELPKDDTDDSDKPGDTGCAIIAYGSPEDFYPNSPTHTLGVSQCEATV
jgi:hypothetical protein